MAILSVMHCLEKENKNSAGILNNIFLLGGKKGGRYIVGYL